MKYYSEQTKKMYDSVEELKTAEETLLKEKEEAEKFEQELREARAARAKEVEEAYKVADECKKNADKLLKEFCEDYGSYHTTITKPYLSLFDDIFNNFFKF